MDSPATPRLLGQSVARKEDRRLLTGHGQFVDDIVMSGMLHCAFVRSTVARGRIVSIDIEEAKALAGVHAVYLAADFADIVEPQPFLLGGVGLQPVYRPLAGGDVRFVGDPIALVVADNRYIAEDAAELVFVDYEPEEAVVDYLTAAEQPPIHPELGANLSSECSSPTDDELDRIFTTAPHVITETLSQQRHACVPLETRGLIVSWSPPGELTVWLATQNAHMARGFIARSLKLGEHQVRVIAKDVGGGFGLKYHLDRDEIAIVAAATLIGRPIKWIEDRSENLLVAGQSREDTVTAKMAFDKDGRILAAHLEHCDNMGAYPLLSCDMGMFAMMVFTGPYRVPRFGFQTRSYLTNSAGRQAYRGPWMIESVVREWMMDVAAKRIGIDPIELRRRNVLLQQDQPYSSPGGLEYSRVTPAETLEQALDILDLSAFRAEQAAARLEGRYLGLGASIYIEPAGMSGGRAGSEVAELRMEASGDIVASVSAGSAGNSIETTMAQVIADAFAVPLDRITVQLGDTATSGYGAGAGGSRQGMIVGGAVKKASLLLREKLIQIAAHVLEADPATLTFREGGITEGGGSNRWLSFKEIAEIAYFDSAKLPPNVEPGLEMRSRYLPRHSYSNASHLCVCEVDAASGIVTLKRWIVSEDCGVMINPSVVEGQVSGGVVQAIGGVLLEHNVIDEYGNPLATSLKDYLLPLATGVPTIEFGHLCTPSDSLLGVKGVGEGGAIVAPAAIINAVTDALTPFGATFNHLPLSPSRIVEAVAAGKTRALS